MAKDVAWIASSVPGTGLQGCLTTRPPDLTYQDLKEPLIRSVVHTYMGLGGVDLMQVVRTPLGGRSLGVHRKNP